MKTICTLTDKEVLGTEELSSRAPRLTARDIAALNEYIVSEKEK